MDQIRVVGEFLSLVNVFNNLSKLKILELSLISLFVHLMDRPRSVTATVGKITCFCFNYNYSLKFSITITHFQVIVIQLQFQLQLQ